MTFQIKAASLRDIHAIYLLEKEIFYADAYPHLDLAFLLLTPSAVNLKAVSETDKIVGFVAGTRSWFNFQPAWVITLGVAQSHQRQGIGRALLLACEEKMARPRVRLTVREHNKPAIYLYEQCGYEYVFTRPCYYRDGENGLVMEKHR